MSGYNVQAHANDDFRDKSAVTSRRSWRMLAASWGLEVCPFDHFFSKDGFTAYLHANGCVNFHAAEFARPRTARVIKVAKTLKTLLRDDDGMPLLIPARMFWPDMLLPIRIMQDARDAIGAPIHGRYGWRPWIVHRAVYTNPDDAPKFSDHLYAAAIDVDFESKRDTQRAFARVIQPIWDSKRLWLSVGHTSSTRLRVHLGALTPRALAKGGQRQWAYQHGATKRQRQLHA